MTLSLDPHPSFSGRPGPVLVVVADGVGIAPAGPSNAVTEASTPTLDALTGSELSCALAAHGVAVGLPALLRAYKLQKRAARVGFDCQLEEETWVVRMYLGTTEIVGGPMDGQMRPMSFEIDLQTLFARFQDIDEFFWSVFPENAEHVDEPQAYVTISGKVDGNSVRIHLFATSPEEVGPGMRIFPDGRFEPA